jgi:hypothetical protein
MLDQSIDRFIADQFLPALAGHPKLRGQIELPAKDGEKTRGSFTPRTGGAPGSYTPRTRPPPDRKLKAAAAAEDGNADNAASMKLKTPRPKSRDE